MKEDLKIMFLKNLKKLDFDPYFTKNDIRVKGKLKRMQDERVLAESISDLLDNGGPHFVSDITNTIFEEYQKRLPNTINFRNIMRKNNSYYEK